MILRTYSPRMRSAIANASLPVGIEHHLGEPFAVAQVDEDDPAVVAAPVRPAGERHDAVDELRVELAAIVRAHQLPLAGGEGGTTPIEMMYFSASSTVMSSSTTSLRGTMTK